jgi:hypothetical protein
MLAFSTTAIAAIVLTVIVIGYFLYSRASRNEAGPELGSEIELAANRKPYYDDDVLEGKRLERFQFVGLLFLIVIVIGLPLYWILEPSRQEGALAYSDERAIEWGRELFLPTSEGGFNCSGCHGGMKATGGVAAYAVTDPATNEVKSVNWFAPALNTVMYRFDASEVNFILVYGTTVLSDVAMGTRWRRSDERSADRDADRVHHLDPDPREGCAAGENNPLLCESGTLPSKIKRRSRRPPSSPSTTAPTTRSARRCSTSTSTVARTRALAATPRAGATAIRRCPPAVAWVPTSRVDRPTPTSRWRSTRSSSSSRARSSARSTASRARAPAACPGSATC